MAPSKERLVPITRAFLARYYDNHPVPPLPDDIARLTAELREISDGLMKEFPANSDEHLLMHELDGHFPPKIDQNLWKNRENIEEILFLLEETQRPKSLQGKATSEGASIVNILGELEDKLKRTFDTLKAFQQKNADYVFSTVMTYMPQDFRGSLIRKQRERSERKKQAEVDVLVKAGGSIRDRYVLLWGQQMERRRQLAQLGSATGVYKTFVKYLVGVPQVLLDFIKTINDDQGPMAEQRQRYGPTLNNITKLVLSIRLFLLVLWRSFEEKQIQMHQVSLVQQAVLLYTSEFEKFMNFIGGVFTNSPFFITAEDAGAAESRNAEEYIEAVIGPGKTFEITLNIESVNSYVAWDFSLIQGTINLDIGFHVEYVSPTGEKQLILPYKRYESDQGNFCTILAGSYNLIWDNSYASFFKKSLRYKVDAIPPVADTQNVESET